MSNDAVREDECAPGREKSENAFAAARAEGFRAGIEEAAALVEREGDAQRRQIASASDPTWRAQFLHAAQQLQNTAHEIRNSTAGRHSDECAAHHAAPCDCGALADETPATPSDDAVGE